MQMGFSRSPIVDNIVPALKHIAFIALPIRPQLPGRGYAITFDEVR